MNLIPFASSETRWWGETKSYHYTDTKAPLCDTWATICTTSGTVLTTDWLIRGTKRNNRSHAHDTLRSSLCTASSTLGSAASSSAQCNIGATKADVHRRMMQSRPSSAGRHVAAIRPRITDWLRILFASHYSRHRQFSDILSPIMFNDHKFNFSLIDEPFCRTISSLFFQSYHQIFWN